MSTLVEQSRNSPQASELIFCVPDEWYRRSSTTSRITAASMSPSELTLKRLSELEAEEADAEGTAKAKQSPVASAPASPTAKRSSDGSGGTFSSRRFSSLFDGWLGGSTSPGAAPASPEVGKQEESAEENKLKRPIVSEPVVLDARLASGSESGDESGLDEEDFEQMIVGYILS